MKGATMNPCVKTNIAVPMMPAGRRTLYFFPDRLLVFEIKNIATTLRSVKADGLTDVAIEDQAVRQEGEHYVLAVKHGCYRDIGRLDKRTREGMAGLRGGMKAMGLRRDLSRTRS